MSIFLLAILSLFSVQSFAQDADTIINENALIGKEFTLTAPQKYYVNYQWILPDGSSREGNTLTTVANTLGVQVFQCTARDACTDNIALFYVNVSVPVAPTLYKTTHKAADISSVYPNPATEFLIIHYVSIGGGTPTFNLISVDGKLVRNTTLFCNDQSISLQGLASGVYLYKILEDGKIMMQGKITKQ